MTISEMSLKICIGNRCYDCPHHKLDCMALAVNDADEDTVAALTDIYNSLFNSEPFSEADVET